MVPFVERPVHLWSAIWFWKGIILVLMLLFGVVLYVLETLYDTCTNTVHLYKPIDYLKWSWLCVPILAGVAVVLVPLLLVAEVIKVCHVNWFALSNTHVEKAHFLFMRKFCAWYLEGKELGAHEWFQRVCFTNRIMALTWLVCQKGRQDVHSLYKNLDLDHSPAPASPSSPSPSCCSAGCDDLAVPVPPAHDPRFDAALWLVGDAMPAALRQQLPHLSRYPALRARLLAPANTNGLGLTWRLLAVSLAGECGGIPVSIDHAHRLQSSPLGVWQWLNGVIGVGTQPRCDVHLRNCWVLLILVFYALGQLYGLVMPVICVIVFGQQLTSLHLVLNGLYFASLALCLILTPHAYGIRQMMANTFLLYPMSASALMTLYENAKREMGVSGVLRDLGFPNDLVNVIEQYAGSVELDVAALPPGLLSS